MTIQTSKIDSTKPTQINPTTQSVRDNFQRCKDEIDKCFINDASARDRLDALESAQAAPNNHFLIATRNSAQVFTTSPQVVLTMNVILAGNQANYDTTTGEYTARETGLYLVNYALFITPQSGTAILTPQLRINGEQVQLLDSQSQRNTDSNTQTKSAYVYLSAGQKLSIAIATTRLVTMRTVGSDGWEKRNRITIAKI